MDKKGRRTRSMRGVSVDFDLIEIHAQLANQPKPTEVSAREEFIESRLNRRLKRRIENQKKLEEEQLRQKQAKEEVEDGKPKIAIKEITAPEVPEEIPELPSFLEEPKIRTIKKKKIEE